MLNIFGKIASNISKGIGIVIFVAVAVAFDIQLALELPEKLVPVALSGVALITVLAALSFGMAQSEKDDEHRQQITIAGEKIFHSCILYVQAIFIRYALDRLSSMPFAKNDIRITNIIIDVTVIIVTILSIYGTYFFIYGFRMLNNIFWLRYEKRVEKQSRKQKG
jgi:hypothetical protein